MHDGSDDCSGRNRKQSIQEQQLIMIIMESAKNYQRVEYKHYCSTQRNHEHTVHRNIEIHLSWIQSVNCYLNKKTEVEPQDGSSKLHIINYRELYQADANA